MIQTRAPNRDFATTTPRAIPRRHGYSDRDTGLRPLPLGLSVGVTASLFAAYLFMPQQVIDRIADAGPLITRNIPLDPPPPPPPPEPRSDPVVDKTVQAPQRPTLVVPKPIIDIPSDPVPGPLTVDKGFASNGTAVLGSGTAKPADPPRAVPDPTPVKIDPAYSDRMQPEYPAREARLQQEGKVRVSVLVGTDGRVKRVRDLGSSSSGFFRATERHALREWRFLPATRAGKPIEAWHVMTLTFQLRD